MSTTNTANMTIQEKEIWRDSRETDTYIATALHYDNEEWNSPTDENAIWQRAADLAAGAGEDDDYRLCWGVESRAVADARVTVARAEAAQTRRDAVARLAEITNLDVTQLSDLTNTPCDWLLLCDGPCRWFARISELSEAATDELLAVQRGDISDPDCAAWTDWCDAHPAYREADVPAPILTAALAHLDREAGEAVCTGW